MRRALIFLSLAAVVCFGCSTVDAESEVWEEYEQVRAKILELSALLAEKDRDPAVIQERLKALRERERHLLCWDRPDIANPREILESMGLRMRRLLVDRAHVDAFVTAKEADGTLSEQDAHRLRTILSRAGDEVMNPASLGASQINERIAKALLCYGLDSARADALEPDPPLDTTHPPGTAIPTGLRYFQTCGDPVCRDNGYRGPFPDVPTCESQQAGEVCLTEGERCDLANSCNMFLVCARTDPATRCAR